MWPKVGPGTQRAKLSAPAAEARSCGEVCKCLPHAASVGSWGLVHHQGPREDLQVGPAGHRDDNFSVVGTSGGSWASWSQARGKVTKHVTNVICALSLYHKQGVVTLL